MPAIGSMAEAAQAQVLPKFQDGMISMQELLRQPAESITNEIMDAGADEICGEHDSRNGYSEHKLETCVGTLTLRVPKLRQGSFCPEDLLARYQRADRAPMASVAEMHATEAGIRKLQR